MPRRRSLLIATALVAPALALTACGGGADSATSTATGGAAKQITADTYIPVISKGFQHQFWQAVKQGAEGKASELGVKITFEGPDNESQVDKQIEMLQTALDKKPAAICFAALDSKAAIPLLQKAKAQNIPIIGFDSGVDSDIPVATAATDNLKASAEAAKRMSGFIGGSGEIAVVVHDQTSRTGIDRRDGFVKEIQANHPNIKIVDIQYGGGDPLKTDDLTKTILQAHPNLKGIFAANEGSAIGVLNAVKATGKQGKVVVIGYDAGKQQKDAVRSGLAAGAITQDPVGIGAKCVESAVKAIKGEPVEKNVDTGFRWYDKSNVDAAELKPLLYD